MVTLPQRGFYSVADFKDEFVCGGCAATHKFIPGLSNADFTVPPIQSPDLRLLQEVAQI
jgi:hypothetical protein